MDNSNTSCTHKQYRMLIRIWHCGWHRVPKTCLTPWKVDLTGNVVSLTCGIYCILDIWILVIQPIWWHGLSEPTCSHGSQACLQYESLPGRRLSQMRCWLERTALLHGKHRESIGHPEPEKWNPFQLALIPFSDSSISSNFHKQKHIPSRYTADPVTLNMIAMCPLIVQNWELLHSPTGAMHKLYTVLSDWN